MDNFIIYIIFFILALIECSLQDNNYPVRLACGGMILNIRFPLDKFPALQQSSSTVYFNYEPIEKYAHIDPDTCDITGGNMNVANASQASGSVSMDPTKSSSSGPQREIFTMCVNCTSKCTSNNMQSLVSRLRDTKGLWVFVRYSAETESIVKGMDLKSKNDIKFAYIENDNYDKDWFPNRNVEACVIQNDQDTDALRSFSKTSVLFVSISFIILMVISLAWLVFYYVQRFRYAHAKDRLQRRLFNAAKKALTRIPTKPVKAGDKELDSDCPVCIDPYRAGDIVRMLPCRHVFHKTCVDPWLLEHRTCPMCKSDILKAFGYHVSMSGRRRTQFSAQIDDQHAGAHADSDHLSVDAQSTVSESNAYPFPVVSEIHDPFSFTPATSPQLVQVMHATNARGFSIIPLTVHNGSGFASGSAGNFTTINASVERCPTAQSIANGQASHTGDSNQPSTSQNAGRGLKSASGARRAASRGHVVNLVHVRSRSLSHGNFAQASSSMTPPPVENNRPSALFRAAGRVAMPLRTVQTAGTITIEVAPNQIESRPASKSFSTSKPCSPQPEISRNLSTAIDMEPEESEPFPINAPPSRMAVSQEDIPCGSRAESATSTISGNSRPITRGQSAKTVRSIPSAVQRKVLTPEPRNQFAAFQILPPPEQRPKAVIASTKDTAAVPLNDVISVESL